MALAYIILTGIFDKVMNQIFIIEVEGIFDRNYYPRTVQIIGNRWPTESADRKRQERWCHL